MPLDILIGGEWRPGRGPSYTSHYPADGSVAGELNAASIEDVNEAVEAADSAQVLWRVATIIRDRAEDLAQLQRLDNGKPIGETRALVASAANTFQYMASACETLEEELTPSRGDYLTMSVYEPNCG